MVIYQPNVYPYSTLNFPFMFSLSPTRISLESFLFFPHSSVSGDEEALSLYITIIYRPTHHPFQVAWTFDLPGHCHSGITHILIFGHWNILYMILTTLWLLSLLKPIPPINLPFSLPQLLKLLFIPCLIIINTNLPLTQLQEPHAEHHPSSFMLPPSSTPPPSSPPGPKATC